MEKTSESFAHIEQKAAHIKAELTQLDGGIIESKQLGEQVLHHAESISAVVQETAAGSEEISASALEQLSSFHKMAESVNNLVSLTERLNDQVRSVYFVTDIRAQKTALFLLRQEGCFALQMVRFLEFWFFPPARFFRQVGSFLIYGVIVQRFFVIIFHAAKPPFCPLGCPPALKLWLQEKIASVPGPEWAPIAEPIE
ncbi:hypothetical protein ACSE3M_17165 [Bacillus velezensis]